MDQITVPQFLDVEDKIMGSITVRQFLEMLVGALFIFIFYKIFDFSLFVVSALVIVGLVIVFAFVKVSGQLFHYFILNFLTTMMNPKLQVWRKGLSKYDLRRLKKSGEEKKETIRPIAVRAAVASSRLSELALIVDTGGVYRGESINVTKTL